MNSSYRQVFSAIILRFLNLRTPVESQEAQPAVHGSTGPSQGEQPVVRLLDNAEDIAEQYSRPIPHEMPPRKGSADRQCSKAPVTSRKSRDFPKVEDCFSGRERGEGKVVVQGNVGNTALPAPSSQEREISGLDNRRKGNGSAISHPAHESNLLAFTCDTAHATFCGEFVCEEPAVGICKHCKQFVCKRCVKSGECYAADRHEVSLQ